LSRASTFLQKISKKDVDGRDIGERDAVLRTAMPGHDEICDDLDFLAT
jgi:hypothetical protein